MNRLFIEYDQEVPQIAYSGCMHCNSLVGISRCQTKGRGCCFHFPQFNLQEIQRMTFSTEGMQVLDTIRNHPGTLLHSHHLHAKGFFDEKSYQKYCSEGVLLGEGRIQDQTIFFRVCPFVKPNFGCTIPPRFRSYICNFFVCHEVLEAPDHQDSLKPYIDERANYVRWLDREIHTLKHILVEEKVNLITDFNATLELLRTLPQSVYDFPLLPPVLFPDDRDNILP